MSDANQYALYSVKETAWGETPDMSKKFTEIPFNTEAIVPTNQNQPSEEVREDRQNVQIPRVGIDAAGPVVCELRHGVFNDWYESALASSWVTVSPAAQTVDLDLGDQTLTSAVNGAFNAFKESRYIKIAGASNSSSNGIKKISSVNGAGTIITLVAGSIAADQIGASLTLTAKYLRNGKTIISNLIEKRLILLDAGADNFRYSTGAVVNELELAFAAKAKAMATFNFMAKNGLAATVTQGDGSPTAKSTNPIVTTNAGIGTLLYEGASLTGLQALTLRTNNNLRLKPVVNEDSSIKFGFGDFMLTGNARIYFSRRTEADAVLAGNTVAMEFVAADAGGRKLGIYMPQVRLLNGQPNNGGRNTDVIVDAQFQAKGVQSGYTVQFDYLEP